MELFGFLKLVLKYKDNDLQPKKNEAYTRSVGLDRKNFLNLCLVGWVSVSSNSVHNLTQLKNI